MLKLNKKGFTIVELVIVIAVVAILAAVLIPTFIGLMQTAKTSADIQLVTSLNKVMAMQEALDGKNGTMYNALQDAKANGYDLSKLTPTSEGNDIVWDQSTDRFALVNPKAATDQILFWDESLTKPSVGTADIHKLWKIYDKETGIPETQTYSIYWAGTTAPSLTTLTVGFDAGECRVIDTIEYKHSGAARTVIIRTNGENLTVTAEQDTVNHYGNAEHVDVIAVAKSSYHEYGTTCLISIASGRIVFETEEASKTAVFVKGKEAIVAVAESVPMPETMMRATGVNSFELQTVTATGEIITKTTISVSNGNVTLETTDKDGKKAATPDSVSAIQTKLSTANSEGDAKAYLPVEVGTVDAFKAALSGNAKTIKLTNDLSFTSCIEIKRSLTIDGNGHSIKGSANRVIRITTLNLTVLFKDLGIISTCTASTDVRGLSFDNGIKNCKVTLDHCSVSASYYAINLCHTDNIELTIKHGSVSGWAAINSYSSNSKFVIEDSVLSGLNDKTESQWNNFSTIVFDGDGLANVSESGKHGTNNTVQLTNTTVYASSVNGNNQAWLGIQYGAKDNTITADSKTKIIDTDGNDQSSNISVNTYLRDNPDENTYNVNSTVVINGVETKLSGNR